jgi:hypothetical protein
VWVRHSGPTGGQLVAEEVRNPSYIESVRPPDSEPHLPPPYILYLASQQFPQTRWLEFLVEAEAVKLVDNER